MNLRYAAFANVESNRAVFFVGMMMRRMTRNKKLEVLETGIITRYYWIKLSSTAGTRYRRSLAVSSI